MSFLPALIGAGGALAGGIFAGQGANQGETRMQRTQRKLIDQLLSSLGGKGPYSDLFNFDEESFQKSVVEPAQARFRNQTAPQIQQQSIAYGQQRGTGLEDQLTRAGVDLDALLNSHMMQFQESAKGRQQNAISSILGMGAGAPRQSSFGQDIMSTLSGYLSSPAYEDLSHDIFRQPQTTAPSMAPSPRKGYAAPRQRIGFATSMPDWQWGTH